MYPREKVNFDPDIFRQIIAGLDGYWTLPTPYEVEGGITGLPGMPKVSIDCFEYHYRFALDRGFVINHVNTEEPSRITYQGKQFLMETENPDTWNKVKDTWIKWGSEAAIKAGSQHAVIEAIKSFLS